MITFRDILTSCIYFHCILLIPFVLHCLASVFLYITNMVQVELQFVQGSPRVWNTYLSCRYKDKLLSDACEMSYTGCPPEVNMSCIWAIRFLLIISPTDLLCIGHLVLHDHQFYSTGTRTETMGSGAWVISYTGCHNTQNLSICPPGVHEWRGCAEVWLQARWLSNLNTSDWSGSPV